MNTNTLDLSSVHSGGVSVVVPCYNYAHYLPIALESALSQTFSESEVIVVDDGSTDETQAVAKSYGERVRYIYQQNAGLSAARNTGIRHASHPYVAFLDADDRWMQGFLEKATATFAALPADYALVACKSLPVDTAGLPTGQVRRDVYVQGELTAKDIVMRTCFSPSTVVVRRDALGVCGLFDETLTSSEDRDLWIRIGTRFRLFLLPDTLVHIRNHPGSMSKNADRMKLNTRRVLRKAYRGHVVPKWHVAFWLRVLSVNLFQCAWMYYDQGRHAKAIIEMFKSIVVWPWLQRPALINEPLLFRVRALRRFLWHGLRGK